MQDAKGRDVPAGPANMVGWGRGVRVQPRLYGPVEGTGPKQHWRLKTSLPMRRSPVAAAEMYPPLLTTESQVTALQVPNPPSSDPPQSSITVEVPLTTGVPLTQV